jgi:glutamate dehydrogenase/leucine dehydrogenase
MSALERVVHDAETGVRGFLVIDALRNGKACGGVRIVPDGSLEEARLLARCMRDKFALFDVSQSGGGKAVVCIPPDASPERRKRMLQAFARAVAPEVRTKKFIPWMCLGSGGSDVQEFLRGAGLSSCALQDSAECTAWSVFGSMKGAANALRLPLKGATVAIEGFGKVGSALARLVDKAGGKIVAVSTQEGAVHDPDGLDVPALLALREKHGDKCVSHVRAGHISLEELKELAVTFLVPAARHHSITALANVRAKIVVPSANAPYTDDAPEALARRGVVVLPAELCFSGGHIGPRLLQYGFSAVEARRRVVRDWTALTEELLAQCGRAKVAPVALINHVIGVQLARLQDLRSMQAFEHALRSSWVPRLLRKRCGSAFVRNRMSALQRRMRDAATFFAQNSGNKPVQQEYVAVMPVRDEEAFVARAIESVVRQSARPALLVVVDDGSRDRTADIVKQYAATHSWIRLVQRADRGHRRVGPGVAEAFADGYALASSVPHAFVAKVDGDVLLPPSYFAELLRRFDKDERLGIASGSFTTFVGGRPHWERAHAWYAAGPARLYRAECLSAIGGIEQCLNWDYIDLCKARMQGWATQNVKDVRALHLRPTSSSTGVWRKGLEREGRAAYWVGTHPLFALARAANECVRPPYVLGGLFFLKGFFSGFLKNAPQYPDESVRNFIREQQLRRLKIVVKN